MKLFRPAYESDPTWQKQQWEAKHPEATGVWKNVLALREMVAAVRADAVKKLGNISPSSGPDNLVNRIAELKFKAVAVGQELAVCEALLDAGEAGPEFELADKQYAPLVKAAEEKLAREEKARQDRQRKEAALRDAREEAKRRALESFESDPAVVAAKQELAEAQAVAGEL